MTSVVLNETFYQSSETKTLQKSKLGAVSELLFGFAVTPKPYIAALKNSNFTQIGYTYTQTSLHLMLLSVHPCVFYLYE